MQKFMLLLLLFICINTDEKDGTGADGIRRMGTLCPSTWSDPFAEEWNSCKALVDYCRQVFALCTCWNGIVHLHLTFTFQDPEGPSRRLERFRYCRYCRTRFAPIWRCGSLAIALQNSINQRHININSICQQGGKVQRRNGNRPGVKELGWPGFSCQKRSPRRRSRKASEMMQPKTGPTMEPGKGRSDTPAVHRSISSGDS